MAKYSYEFKLKVVEAFLKGKGSYAFLAKQHEVVYLTIQYI